MLMGKSSLNRTRRVGSRTRGRPRFRKRSRWSRKFDEKSSLAKLGPSTSTEAGLSVAMNSSHKKRARETNRHELLKLFLRETARATRLSTARS